MAISERDLLKGLELLPNAELAKITDEETLRGKVQIKPPESLPTDRQTQHDIKGVLEDGVSKKVPDQVTRIVNALEADAEGYWFELWLLLYYCKERMEDLESRGAPPSDAEILFRELRGGVAQNLQLRDFNDHETPPKARKGEVLRKGAGWLTRRRGRTLALSGAVQRQVDAAEYQPFVNLFAEVQPGLSSLAAALTPKKALLAECLRIELKYWQAMK